MKLPFRLSYPFKIQNSKFKIKKLLPAVQNLLLLLLLIFFASCASLKKFTGEDKKEKRESTKDARFGKEIAPAAILPVRLLIAENSSIISFVVETPLNISADEKTVAVVKTGNEIKIENRSDQVILSVNGNTFNSNNFKFTSAGENEIFFFNGKKYRGTLVVSPGNNIVNIIALEDYLKGVLPAEMPLGKGDENYEALKAFAICARTYTMMKLNENKQGFDLYVDVRDQVYGGVEKEKELSNKAIASTSGMILQYNGEPAGIFYSASCGGYSEEGGNVFVNSNKPYLTVVKDGDQPYCSITPRFEWVEKYSVQEFVNRLLKAGLVSSSGFYIESIKINSRFNSGRVNELEINLASDTSESKEIKIYGNQIRSIIRTGDDKGILRSTMFDVSFNTDTVTIAGKGYGHGVGLCQWGAIAQSRQGIGYLEILKHYFPGTEVRQLIIKN